MRFATRDRVGSENRPEQVPYFKRFKNELGQRVRFVGADAQVEFGLRQQVKIFAYPGIKPGPCCRFRAIVSEIVGQFSIQKRVVVVDVAIIEYPVQRRPRAITDKPLDIIDGSFLNITAIQRRNIVVLFL